MCLVASGPCTSLALENSRADFIVTSFLKLCKWRAKDLHLTVQMWEAQI